MGTASQIKALLAFGPDCSNDLIGEILIASSFVEFLCKRGKFPFGERALWGISIAS